MIWSNNKIELGTVTLKMISFGQKGVQQITTPPFFEPKGFAMAFFVVGIGKSKPKKIRIKK